MSPTATPPMAPSLRAPLGALSCPYSHQEVGSYEEPPATDYWNPPTCARQHARQRALAIVLAFILAALAAQAGW